MCGIIGSTDSMITLNAFKESQLLMRHRGPDSQDTITLNHRVHLGHNRLSIIDLSDNGRQPFLVGNYAFQINGEIYNYKTLRNELSNFNIEWKSETDSEVVFHYYLHYGLNKLLNRIEGMFAFSIYDRELDELILVRDHFGVKPLYYSLTNEGVIWSSEISPIKNLLSQNLTLNKTAIYDFHTYQYIPPPKTAWNEINQVEPASLIVVRGNKLIQTKRYWNVPSKTLTSRHTTPTLDEDVARQLFDDSVKSQLISDVKISLLLSGGKDSSSIASSLKRNHRLDIECLTLSYPELGKEEGVIARETCKALGLKHTDFQISGQDIDWDLYYSGLTDLTWISSFFPTEKIFRSVPSHVKVVLSGDGADEMFGGYRWYGRMHKLKKVSIPSVFKGIAAKLSTWLKSHNSLSFRLKLLSCETDLEQYSVMLGGKTIREKRVLKKQLHIKSDYDDLWFFKKYDNSGVKNVYERFSFIDFHTFLPEICLKKIDIASMINSKESRVPFLDKKLVEYVFTNRTLKDGNKSLLNKFIDPRIRILLSNQKEGFGVDKGFLGLGDSVNEVYENWLHKNA